MRKVFVTSVVMLLFVSGTLVFAAPKEKKQKKAPAGSTPPEWAKTGNGVAMEYPNGQYIAQRGRGADLISAQNDGVAQISRWITSEIETSVSSRESITEHNGETDEFLKVDQETFITSQTSLFAVRFAPDPWYNATRKQWETVAFIDRDEAWAIYEPQVRQRVDAFTKLYKGVEADVEPFRQFIQYSKVQVYAEQELISYLRFAQLLHPQNARRYDETLSFISAIPQALEGSRARASIFIDCPIDLDGMTVTALTQVISDEGFPVTQNRSSASTVCAVAVDEGKQTLQAGTFYTPRVRITITGKSGTALFSCSFGVEGRSGAVNPDVAKLRAYTALVGVIRQSFHGELIADSGK